MELWTTWRDAATRPAIHAGLVALYQDVAAEIAGHGAQCWASGRCCHFQEFGHRLYVTGLEIAWVGLQVKTGAEQNPEAWATHPGCPFQQGHQCGIHTVRPLGCRVFFCQQGTSDWQHDLYERFLGRLKALHDEHALPYRYIEWRGGFAQMLRET